VKGVRETCISFTRRRLVDIFLCGFTGVGFCRLADKLGFFADISILSADKSPKSVDKPNISADKTVKNADKIFPKQLPIPNPAHQPKNSNNYSKSPCQIM
jgi:hypothetical protein